MQIAKRLVGKPQIKCPRCGAKLTRTRLRKTRIDRCSKGCGIWIDQQQLDQFSGTPSKRYEITNDLPAQMWDHQAAL